MSDLLSGANLCSWVFEKHSPLPKLHLAIRATVRCIAALLAVLASSAMLVSPAGSQTKVWHAGNYSFSDELGGFTITSVSGKGTSTDPIVIQEELHSASPVTLSIRASGAALGGIESEGNLATSALFLRIVTVNGSKLPWIEFEFELQEILNQSSVFGDGLSFDQRRENPANISSTAFAHFDRDFEPYDRLRFSEGKIDAGRSGAFEFALTDFTPRWQFFLVQDPRIPSS